jgi:hypothetical protein
MELEFDPPEDLGNPGENLPDLAKRHRNGEETRFIMVQQPPDETRAIINVNPIRKHTTMLHRFAFRRDGSCPHFNDELKDQLGDTVIGGGVISQNEIRWGSPGCREIFKYDRPADKTRAEALLSDLRGKFDAWLATMP